MKHELSCENLSRLFAAIHDDEEAIDYVLGHIKTFENYHRAIFEMEMWMKLCDGRNMGGEEYRERYSELDSSRTRCHDAVLSAVNILNRMAERNGIAPIYGGTVAETVPHRREVADAVLMYISGVISERI